MTELNFVVQNQFFIPSPMERVRERVKHLPLGSICIFLLKYTIASLARLYKKKEKQTFVLFLFFLNQTSATSYLPRGWPPKYCRHYESLRPCSGWERVFSSRLVTDKPVTVLLAHSKLHNNYKLTQPSISFDSPLAPVEFSSKTLTSLRYVRACSSCSRKPTLHSHRLPYFRKSPRPISISRLKMLPLLHL